MIGIFFAILAYIGNSMEKMSQEKRAYLSIVIGLIFFISWIVGMTMGKVFFGEKSYASIVIILAMIYILIRFLESFDFWKKNE